MAIVLDIILVVIAGVSLFFAIKNGLVKTVINSFALILAAILSLFISPIFKNIFSFSGEYSEVTTYLVVFLVSWVIVKVLSIVLDNIISALPIIRTFNTLGGLILGIIMGIFRISIYCIIVGGILSLGERFEIQLIQGISLEDTFLLKYVYEYNPLYLLINLILK